MILTRRGLMLLGAVAFVAASIPASAQSSGDSAFVETFGNQLVSVVNGEGELSQKEKRIRPLIDQALDVDSIARFCLGRFLARATPEQVSEYTRLFHDVLVNNIVSKIGEYRGVSFRLTGTEAKRGDDTIVGSIVLRPNNAPNNVRWVVTNTAGGPKIVDVVAEGTSLRLTQRSDYAAYMSQHDYNIDSLLKAMRTMIGAS